MKYIVSLVVISLLALFTPTPARALDCSPAAISLAKARGDMQYIKDCAEGGNKPAAKGQPASGKGSAGTAHRGGGSAKKEKVEYVQISKDEWAVYKSKVEAVDKRPMFDWDRDNLAVAMVVTWIVLVLTLLVFYFVFTARFRQLFGLHDAVRLNSQANTDLNQRVSALERRPPAGGTP